MRQQDQEWSNRYDESKRDLGKAEDKIELLQNQNKGLQDKLTKLQGELIKKNEMLKEMKKQVSDQIVANEVGVSPEVMEEEV